MMKANTGIGMRGMARWLPGVLCWGWLLAVAAAVPPVPSQVAASRGTYPGGVRIWWTAVDGAQAYDIWRNTVPDTQTAQYLASVGGSRLEYIDTSIPPHTSYYYWVRTVIVAGVPSDFGYYHEGYWVPGPPPPTNVQATDGLLANRIRVTWDPVAGATSYQVWRHLENDRDAAVMLATTSGTSYDDVAIDPLLTYYYWVKAVNAEGVSGFSWANPGYAKPEPPGQVQGVSASDGNYLDKILLTWDALPGAARYEVWRAASDRLWESERIADNIQEASFADDTTPALEVFTYWVRAVNAVGYGPFSLPDSGYREVSLPARPLYVAASDGMYAERTRVTWQEADRALAYDILRNVVRDLPSATVISRVPAGTGLHEYWDSSGQGGTVYFYWVRGVNHAGEGETSWSTSGYWNPGPAAPTNIQASDGTVDDAVQVTWLAASGAIGYEVWRNVVRDSSSAVKLASVGATAYLDTTAEPGELYYYWVKAFNAVGTSGFSWTASGYTAGPVPYTRTLAAAMLHAQEGAVVTVPLTLEAKGDEHAWSFSLLFDPNLLEYYGATLGSGVPLGSLLIEHTADAGLGRIGVAVALPPGGAVPAGPAEAVRVEVRVRPGTADRFLALGFADQPTAREMVNAAAQPLAAQWTDGGIHVSAATDPGYEADVSPLPGGDGKVTLQDWVQVGRFVAGLDPMPTGSLFQRADCAPRATLGNGSLTLADWVQAGRYAQGLDPLTPAGGPDAPVGGMSGMGLMMAPLSLDVPAAAAVSVSVASGSLSESPRTPVLLDSAGEVNAVSFSVQFDAATLQYEDATVGPEVEQAGGMLLLNTSQAQAGIVGVAVAMPPGQTLPAGLRKMIDLRFVPRDPEFSGETAVALTDGPLARTVIDVMAHTLTAEFLSGTVSRQPPEEGGGQIAPLPMEARVETFDRGDFVFSWISRPGLTYRVEYSPDLVHWHPLDRVTGQEIRTIYRRQVEGETSGFLRVVEEQ